MPFVNETFLVAGPRPDPGPPYIMVGINQTISWLATRQSCMVSEGEEGRPDSQGVDSVSDTFLI